MSLLNRYKQKLEDGAKTKSLLDRVRIKLAGAQQGINEKYFLKWAAMHRDHQKVCVDATEKEDNGQIIIPTGTGKTRVQCHIHVADMIEKTKANQAGVYVIGAHRLLLCAQLMDDLRDLCIQCRIPINVLYVGSARNVETPPMKIANSVEKKDPSTQTISL